MVTRKNPLAGAFSLILSMVALAGLFAMLLAEFIFVLQVLVYAGAIMVLIIFTIMLLNLKKEELAGGAGRQTAGVIVTGAGLRGRARTGSSGAFTDPGW